MTSTTTTNVDGVAATTALSSIQATMGATAALFASPNTTASLDTSNLHDPLKMNIKKQVRALLGIISSHPRHAELETRYSSSVDTLKMFVVNHSVRNEADKRKRILTAISRLLSVPELVEDVVRLFRPVLVDLFARWLLVVDENQREEEEGVREERLEAFAKIVEVYEEVFPMFHEFLIRFFPRGPLHFIDSQESLPNVSVKRLHRLLLAYFRIQQANRELPLQLTWPLSPLSKLIWSTEHGHGDPGVKLLAIRCYAYQCGMGEAEREKVERQVLGMAEGEMCSVDCWVYDGGSNVEGEERVLDGWVVPALEVKRVREMREGLHAVNLEEYYELEENEEACFIDEYDLSPHVANIHGVLLFRRSTVQEWQSGLVPIPTSIAALRVLALHISMRVPTLLTSSPSAGKSLLLNHLAGILHPEMKNQVITIHLADTSLDPRSLLGSYISSPTHPGNFEWKEGVLIRAMREGRWVIFEDIDRGSNEVLGVIKPLIESMRLGNWIGARAKLDVPSRGRVIAHQDFLVFATRSIHPSRNGKFVMPTFFGAHKFCEVIVKAPQGDELKIIVERRFQKLEGSAAESLVDLWESVRGLGTAGGVRDVGLRELEKLCARVERLLPASHQSMDIESSEGGIVPLWSLFVNPSLREEIYLEARDVFFGAGATTTAARSHLEAVAALIGKKLGLDEERREWLLKGRTPAFTVEKDVNGNVVGVCAGRTRLDAKLKKSLAGDLPPLRPFAMHRPAICLLSRIMTSLAHSEPVLLTGETGTGKTSVVTHLASLLGRSLVSLNLSHQTESSDLIGGLKPVDTRVPASVLQERFLELFGLTFSRKKNEKFETEVRKAVNEGRWKRLVGLWRESGRLAKERLATKEVEETSERNRDWNEPEVPRKRRRVDPAGSSAMWAAFLKDVDEFDVQHVQGKGKFAFGFVEGPLVKALRSGDWILLDEINLASPETLECISGLLYGPTASITLTEQGSLEPVPRHPDFRLFACMNPATDVGKKDLPPNIRYRFTEIDVPPPDADKDTLLSIINKYIGGCAAGDKGVVMSIAELYIAVKHLAEKRQLADGANHRPHFSMRTLARALTFAADMASTYPLRRSVWEGCLMAFTMVLDPPSAEIVLVLMHKHLLEGVSNPGSMLRREPSVPSGRSPDEYIKLGPFYLEKGSHPEDPMEDYIITPSVETKLVDLARIISTRRLPVLIEGPTSSGKTSSIEYLAGRTGHKFVRINNHEHTDIQEYLGSYVSDPLTGKLVFKDGLLVRALRNGDWIVLDELNLAPTDVLEALNRLLDDNRELVIPETQEVIRPHPHFMLFATQNPPGLYAGRKILSRAFRSRFLEVHFQDVPQAELESILCQRCRIAPSYGKRIVAVFRELQKRRQAGRVFESKHGFATLRDLFRWANRDAIGYQELADNGYMLLAERARREDDKIVVKEVIQSIMGVQISEDGLYNLHQPGADIVDFLGAPLPPSSKIIWTKAMQRLYILVCRALKFNEPVLLVGETGSGKTSACQVFADATGQKLYGVNCHQNTETADIIGALRPVRNRTALEAQVFQEVSSALTAAGVQNLDVSFDHLATASTKALKSSLSPEHRERLTKAYSNLLKLQSIFEWHDGPLIEAMKRGDIFLLDEISLADDSVLERLNSVLEPGRMIVLAEKGGSDSEHPVVKAADGFKLVATMNPGGDYGKKELSPALRNRFTEIWVPRVDDRADLELIINKLWGHTELKPYTQKVLDYTEWLSTRIGDKSITSLRDIIAWVTFSNAVYQPSYPSTIPATEIFHHAAHMTYLDGLSSLPQLSGYSRDAISYLKGEATKKLHETVPPIVNSEFTPHGPVYDPTHYIQFGSFATKRGPREPRPHTFNLTAPTSRENAMRILRACQLHKPILLEGSPGVGKTSLVAALANISGYQLCRINLSDQTDLIDLFGADLPVEGGAPGEFAWRDAEFLRALQQGHWVLLDEMNLAPQAVLEGLNAILDHRGAVYIPELGRSFTCHPSFRIFAAQNPLSQGGGRKGLPKSFVNRFTKVYVDELTCADLTLVSTNMFPHMDESIIRAMISFNACLSDEVIIQRLFGLQGTPWEFNLRDIIRWGALLKSSPRSQAPVTFLRSIYLARFRTAEDRHQAQRIFDRVFATSSPPFYKVPSWSVSPSHLQIGHFCTSRNNYSSLSRPVRILKAQLAAMETLGDCVSQSWLAIVIGTRDSGKSHLIRALADYTGNALREISINSATDTMDIIGGFEQADSQAHAMATVRDILDCIGQASRNPQGTHNLQRLLKTQDTLLLALSSNVTGETAIALLQQTLSLVSDLVEQPTLDGTIFLKRIETILRSSSTGRFEWVDGPLIRAMRKGEWLLLDDANLCNPSVLDRLNSLCEPNGQLTLNERGLVNDLAEVVIPHPNFRLFMTADPHHGELSRAMRNRGVEIFLPMGLLHGDYSVLLDHLRLPHLEISTEHSNLLSLKQQFLSRGLMQPSFRHAIVTVSSGRSLNQFSALSSVMERLPLYLTPTTEIELNATTFFLSRTFHRAYIPYFRRILDTCGINGELKEYLHAFMNSLSNPPPSPIISRIQDTMVEMRVFSHEILCAQATDDLINESSRALNETSASSILHTLDFIVAAFLTNRGQRIESNYPASLTQAAERVLRSVGTFLDNLSRLNDHLLFLLSSNKNFNDDELLNTMSSMLVMNKCGRYLQEISAHHPLNHSAIKVVACAINEALESVPAPIHPLISHARHLHEVTALSAGVGLFEIWSKWNCTGALGDAWIQANQIDQLARSLDSDKARADLRRQVLQVISLITLPAKSPQHEAELAGIISVLKGELHSHVADPGTLQIAPCVIELGLISERGKLSTTKLEKFLEIMCQMPHESLLHSSAIQHLLWALDMEEDVSARYIHTISQWLDSLWAVSSTAEIGASQLLQPSQLNGAMMLCALDKVTLRLIEDYKRDIDVCTDMTLIDSYQSRSNQLDSLLRGIILAVVESFDGHNALSSAYTMQHDDLAMFLSAVAGGSKTNRLSTLLQKHFEILQSLEHQTDQQKLHRLGFAWVAVGAALLELLIPDTPVDPVATHNTSAMLQQKDLRQLTSELSLHQLLEHMTVGNDDNFLLSQIRHKIKDMSDIMIPALSVPGRDDISRLYTYWSEVWQFRNQVVSHHKIFGLIRSFMISNDNALLQEQVFQESITGFCQRLETLYPQFNDLNMLLKLAMSQIRLGIRLSLKANTINPEALKIVSRLVDYPSVRGIVDAFDHEPLEARISPILPAFNFIVLNIIGSNLAASLKDRREFLLDRLEQAYDQVLRLWLIDKAKTAENEAASQSLYRGSTVEQGAMTDSELEEREFLALFPSFENSLDEDTAAPSHRKSRPVSHLSKENIVLMAKLHLDLFSSRTDTQQTLKHADEARKGMLSEILASHMHELPEILDTLGLVHRLRFLREARMCISNLPHDSSYNFYRDPNPQEMRSAAQAVASLRVCLRKLFEKWPEQMVLQHLIDRCDTILGFNLKSPIAKVLSALEQLLLQTDDWEMYANRDNSLSTHRQTLTELIVRWRRLELSCWNGLLEFEARSFAEEASEWWFRIFEATTRGFLSSVESNEEDVYLTRLVPLIDEYISSSPLGQFAFRIQLLQGIECYISDLCKIKSGLQERCLRRVMRIIHSTLQYYQPYQHSLQLDLTERRTALDKEIKDFIKLASWKDINVHALKQSAQKTHHQVYKIIRKFREVLREPIASRLKSGMPAVSEAQPLSAISLNHLESRWPPAPIAIAVSSTGPLSDLKSAFTKFESLVGSKLRSFISRRSSEYADNLAIAIITTSKELSEMTIPTALSSEKRIKFLKSLLVRKRKAFSDLLKELKRVGLSAHVKVDVLHKNSDAVWLRDQPVLTSPLAGNDVVKSETYFSRLCGCLPELRSSLSSHHSDLQTRELQRGLFCLESGFSMAIDLRAHLALCNDSYTRLTRICSRLVNLADTDIDCFQNSLVGQVRFVTRLMCRLSCALAEIMHDLDIFMELQTRDPMHAPVGEVETCLHQCNNLRERLVLIEDDLLATPVLALCKNECQALVEASEFLNSCVLSLGQWSITYPHLQYLFEPTRDWLSSYGAIGIRLERSHERGDKGSAAPLLNTMLYTVQVMVAETNTTSVDVSDDDEENQQLLKGYRETRNFTHLLGVDRVLEQLNALLTSISTGDMLKHVLQCIIPFLDVYQVLVQNQLAVHVQRTKALFKLNFVLCCTLLTLTSQGFCQPPESEEGGDGGGETLEVEDGTGLGEGSGVENASKEIEDESQLEGLKGEGEGNTEKRKDDDDAVEMSEDFAGGLEDVPDDGSQEEDKSDAGSEDGGPDERVENLDPTDPSALDEKIWGDESGPQDSENTDDKTQKDHSEEQSKSSEVVAKEENKRPKKEEGKERRSDAEEQADEAPEADEGQGEEDGEPGAAGAAMDEYVQDANTLDLPDDMDLDAGESKEKDIEDETGGEEEEELPEEIMEDQNTLDEISENQQLDDVQHEKSAEDPMNDQTMEMDGTVESNGEGKGETDPADQDSPQEEVVASLDESPGDGDVNPNAESQTQDQTSASNGEMGSSAADVGQKTSSQEKAADRIGDIQEQSVNDVPQDGKGNAASGIQEGRRQSSAEQKTSSNPLRSLGDTLKEIRQRFDEILNAEATDQPKENFGPSDVSSKLEYLLPEDSDQDMQALGPAAEEKLAKLDDLKFIDENAQTDPLPTMDIDEAKETEDYERPIDGHAPQGEQDATTLRENVKGAILPSVGSELQQHTDPLDRTLPRTDIETEEDNISVEAELRRWQAADFPEAKAELMWRSYESMTHDLAYALCEQLRLILEPTLATRLRGDFRTGKRLNMKKIIPYIASDYTKDKIWLRRTKPSQREYQVLMAIDDSRSMAESHSIHLAYQTLALISKALSRLEAGDIAIAKFGSAVDILHGFDQGPFTDQAGMQVMNAFTFKQKSTNVLSLVDTSLKVLESARERRSMSSSSAADLWQLQIIISDGICQDHDKLRTLLRKAEEQKVMIVFIVLDSLHSGVASEASKDVDAGSILTMTKAEFKSIDGKMEMQLQNYLDSFPFEYYVVLRNVEALPDVLSNTLKQFFERISES